MSLRVISIVAMVSASTFTFGTAQAAADLSVSLSMPAAPYVYQQARYTANVYNSGNATAMSAKVSFQLPSTHTTPVAVMATVGGKSSTCTQSGAVITCSLGDIRTKKSASAYVDVAFPENVTPLELKATASTTSAENSQTNNSVTRTLALNNYAVAFVAPRTVLNSHCTGTGLTSYYECTLFPSSISTHTTVLNADHTIGMPVEAGPDYTGEWWQDDSEHLAFVYYELGVVTAEFEGYGVSAGCWEGMTTFPGSTYMSMYRVCVQ